MKVFIKYLYIYILEKKLVRRFLVSLRRFKISFGSWLLRRKQAVVFNIPKKKLLFINRNRFRKERVKDASLAYRSLKILGVKE